jgi:alpha-mannosidase
MEETPAVTRERVRTALRRDIGPAVFGPCVGVDVSAHHVHGPPISIDDALAATFVPFLVGERWGSAWETTWFRLQLVGGVPAEWRGAEVVVRVDLGFRGDVGFGAEGLVWDPVARVPVQGVSPKHATFRVVSKAEGGEAVDVLIEAAANPVADLDVRPAADLDPAYGGTPSLVLRRAELAVFNREVEALRLDMSVLADLYDHLPHDQPRAVRILRALNHALNVLDGADVVGTALAAREVLAPVLSVGASASTHRLHAVGNAHIDTAWLWPLRETVRKCARTFSTALRLMDEYPDYRFACSQAQQLAWVKEVYPELFARIVERVASGQFELVGAMWVEADCNVPSGESLVRQIVHGTRFFEDEFGVTPAEVWLPDVFGYAASLPQIMRLAGISRFLTQKLSWSTVNRIPHHTFWWEGIDGSRVLTHFPPADTYNGDFTMAQLDHNVRSFRDHGVASSSLYLFGYGDGGGGPTAALLERAARMADVDGAPRVAMSSVEAFWSEADAELVAAGPDAGVWVGELYLEFHRGTYTTSAMSKQSNRDLELLLREAELWSTVGRPAASYPRAELDAVWKDVLLLQFHDVLPGSSIKWVYDDSRAMYSSTRSVVGGLVDQAVDELLSGVDTTGLMSPVAVLNASPAARREAVTIDGVDVMVDVPALGYAVVDVSAAPAAAAMQVVVTDRGLENEHLRVVLDDDGLLSSVWDKHAGREVLPPGERGNVLQLLDDRPANWDAWDVNAFASEQVVELRSMEAVEAVPGGVRVTRRFGRSTVVQTIRLRPGSRRIDFETAVDWHEDRKLLKAAFPVDVHARRATYEIQYGHVERPTHRNTSWDAAQFEVCAHKWIDLSEPGYGVALLNNGKYGHDVLGNVMRISLLRAPVSPDPTMDRGHHEFTYSLFPHSGDLRESGVIEEAYALNMPLRVVRLPAGRVGDREPVWGAFEVSEPGVLVEVVKRAERGESVVVRLYESWGRHVAAAVSTAVPFSGVTVVDLHERNPRPAVVTPDGAIALSLRPFEIVTLALDVPPTP